MVEDLHIFGTDEGPLTRDEVAAVLEDATECLCVWTKRALYYALAFFLSCALVVPFLAGHHLHVYWNSFGKYLLLLSMAILLSFVICVTVVLQVWLDLRTIKKTGRIPDSRGIEVHESKE